MSGSGSDSRTLPVHVFAPDSPYYQRLPASTPAAADSAALVASLVKQTEDYYGAPGAGSLDVNHHGFAPTMYVARATDPVHTFSTDNCQGKAPGWDSALVADHLTAINIPVDAVPDSSSDGSMSIYNPDTDTVTETWVTRKVDGTWRACWGSTIRAASTAHGQFPFPYGASASGLSLLATTIRASELRAGRIEHVVNLAIPCTKAWPAYSWPANRTDGSTPGTALANGQIMRLPTDLDIDALHLSPSARTIAKAAQESGIMITETSGSAGFTAENPAGLRSDPYNEIFRGRWATQEMLGDPARGEKAFPLDRLQVLPMGYRTPVTSTGVAPTPPHPTPTPTPSTPTPSTPTPTNPPKPVTPPATSGQVCRQAADWAGTLDPSGARWGARGWSFDSTKTGTTMVGREVTGTTMDAVYRATAYGMSRYSGELPNGTYDVTLYMAEDYHAAAGKRVFDVSAEGTTVLPRIDLFARTGGRFRAFDPRVRVTVTDGRLDLGFRKIVDEPVVAAVKAVRVS